MQFANKRVLIREDFNVPLVDGQVVSDHRIRLSLPLIQDLIQQKARIILCSHLGRPGQFEDKFSLKPIGDHLARLLKHPVRFEPYGWDSVSVEPGEVVLCENTRFLKGEYENDPSLSKKWAALGEVFIMEAFATSHRAHASTCGVAQYAKQALSGPLLQAELAALDRFLNQSISPVIAIMGGGKVQGKLELLKNLLEKADCLMLGGAMANTFLWAKGLPVGASQVEPDLQDAIKQLDDFAEKKKKQILLPEDVKVQTGIEKNITAVLATDQIVDLGSKTIQTYRQMIRTAETLLWNGPMGKFEDPKFAEGTKAIGQAICEIPVMFWSAAGIR